MSEIEKLKQEIASIEADLNRLRASVRAACEDWGIDPWDVGLLGSGDRNLGFGTGDSSPQPPAPASRQKKHLKLVKG